MNRNLLKLGLLSLLSFSMMSYAQTTGKVGINTDKPTRTLDVDGTTRVRDLPDTEYHNDVALQGFLYNVVAQQDGTLSKQPMSRKRWNLYESAFNTRQNNSRDLPMTNQITANYTQPANCWVIDNSELFIEVPKITNTNVLNMLSWDTWFEVTSKGVTTPARGSFRFFIKYQETDKDGNLKGGVGYTDTIFMTSFSNINSQNSGDYHRVGMSPTYSERTTSSTSEPTYFKRGNYYKVWLVVGLESMNEDAAGKLTVKNWGISSKAESYYQYAP